MSRAVEFWFGISTYDGVAADSIRYQKMVSSGISVSRNFGSWRETGRNDHVPLIFGFRKAVNFGVSRLSCLTYENSGGGNT